MGFIIILPLLALSSWSIFAIFRWLRRGKFGQDWWRAYGILGFIGIALGIWFAFFMEYKIANTRLERFPIPAGFSTREKPDAPWQKSDMPLPVRIGAITTDFLSGVALCLAPLAVAAFFKENTGKGIFAPSNPQ